MRALASLLAMSMLSAGCQLVFSDDDDQPPICAAGDVKDPALVPAIQLRDPYSGLCLDSAPPPCAQADTVAIGDPRWGLCWSGCEGLDEQSCLASDGCQGIYGSPSDEPNFIACWGTAQDGPIRGGDCSAITDAFECSRHDDCISFHTYDASGAPGSFVGCGAEWGSPPPGCYGDQDCQPGEHCNASEICLPPPGCDPSVGCPPVCYGYCQPDNPPEQCQSDADCPADEYCPDVACGGCDPNDPTCCVRTCQPRGMDAPACGTLDEAACIDRTDGCHDWTPPGGCGSACTPLYTGVGCDCDQAGHCTCADWQFTACQ